MNIFPFEIHITVDNNVKNFEQICRNLNVKCIKLNLFNDGSCVDTHTMTSSIFKGNISSLYEKVNNIKKSLINNECQILRTKIETVPWFSDKIQFGYLEHHIDVFENDLKYISNIVKDINEFNSNNIIAISNNINKNNLSLTIRSYNIDYAKFLIKINKIKNFIKQYITMEEDNTVEYAIYDDNIHLDKLWI